MFSNENGNSVDNLIDLISDTVTRPTAGMLNAMMAARVGDDVFGLDPSVNALEEKCADLFGKKAALFCPSGTMTNQIALKIHTRPLDEVICDHLSHVYQYETGGYAANAGIGIQLIAGKNGKITASQISEAIRPDLDWLPRSRLVVLENSCNKGGGSYYTTQEISPISKLCRERNLKLHLDGARLFNVLVETGESTRDVGELFDTLSICLSKGLGAPVGSVLIGDKADIALARRHRKVMGGGMRQCGFLAAAGSYALEHHVDRLKTDNDRARDMGSFLSTLPYVASTSPVQTNIVIFHLKSDAADKMVAYLRSNSISSSAFGPKSVRFVFHLDIREQMIQRVKEVLTRYK